MITGQQDITVKNRRPRFKMFIETETGFDGDANADEDNDDVADLTGLIFADYVY